MGYAQGLDRWNRGLQGNRVEAGMCVDLDGVGG